MSRRLILAVSDLYWTRYHQLSSQPPSDLFDVLVIIRRQETMTKQEIHDNGTAVWLKLGCA